MWLLIINSICYSNFNNNTNNDCALMEQQIEFLKNKYPDKTVWPSLDKNYICVRTILGTSNFGKLPNGDKIEVPITNTEKLHVDTVRLMMHQENSITVHDRPEYCRVCDRYFN